MFSINNFNVLNKITGKGKSRLYQQGASIIQNSQVSENEEVSKPEKIEKKKTKKSTSVRKAKLAYDEGNDVYTDIVEFVGSDAQVVEFLNKHYQLYRIRSFFKKKVVISIDNKPWCSILDLEATLQIGEL